jgi:hypothetical protein
MENTNITNTQQMMFLPDGSNFIEEVERIEKTLIDSGSPDVIVGNSDAFPLKHSFSEGIYVREMFLQKGMFVIGKIHKLDHTFFILKGKLLLADKDGVREIEAPFYGKATSGTKRVAIALEDTIFVNVHPNPNNTKEIDVLEDTFVVSSYEEFKKYKLLN